MSASDYGVNSGKMIKDNGNVINIADAISAIQTLLTSILNNSFAKNGGVYIDDTATNTPDSGFTFIAIQAIEETVVSQAVGNIDNIAGITIPQNTIVYGKFTSIKLTSGSVIAYQG